jgi:hypothetical protein
MKSLSTILLVALLLGGCTRSSGDRFEAGKVTESREQSTLANKPNAGLMNDATLKQDARASFNQPEQAVSLESGFDRKIIRNADLTIEVNSTTEAQQKVTTIAESNGGFVVTSEAKQKENSDTAKRTLDIKLIIRVPSTQFNSALQQIESLATNMPQRNVSGQDVTEEFIDLEARIKTQKALELQFLEIMKKANKVEDALEVQRQIADVRTEIEKLEGRKNFLANRSSLSTITVNIQTPTPIVVSATGFGRTVRDAVSDSLDLASGIVLFFVRFVIVMIPVFMFVILPLGLIALYFKRRAHRVRLAQALEVNPAGE